MLSIEAEPARPQLFTDGDPEVGVDPAPDLLGSALQTLLAARLDRYQRDLAVQLGSRATDPELPISRWPTVTVTLGPDGGVESIPLDDELFQTLFDLYCTDGWESIAAIQTAVMARARPQDHPEQAAGGTPDLTWWVAWRWFTFVRNCLALLVRDTLIDLEQRAAAQVVARLSVCAAEIARSWRSWGFRREVVHLPATGDSPGLDDSQTIVTYTAADTEALRTLAAAIGPCVQQRADWEALLEEILQLRAALARARQLAAARRGRRRTVQLARQADLEKALAARTAIAAATEGWQQQMRAVIEGTSPLALLVVDTLRPGFRDAELEHALGEALWLLHEQLDDLGHGIDPERSLVAATLASAEPTMEGIAALEVDAAGPQHQYARAAIGGLVTEPGFFPLLHEETLRLLIGTEGVGLDGLGPVVIHHHLLAVELELEAAEERAEQLAVVGRTVAKVAAVLSIALLLTPAAEVSPALRGLSVAADAAVLAMSVRGVLDRMDQLGHAVDSRVLDAASGTAALAEIGRLVLARREFADGLTTQLLAELLAIVAGGQFATVRRLLVARGFLADLETLAGEDPV